MIVSGYSLGIPDNIESRFEQGLQELDKSSMIIEDLKREKLRDFN